jgi:hypothetical protein
MRVIITLVVAGVLFVPAADAKEVTKVTACGADDCVTTRDPAILQALMDGGSPTVPPKTDNPVVRLRATISLPGQGAIGQFITWWVPASRLLVDEAGNWLSLPPRAERALQRVTRQLAPLPAARAGIASPRSTPAASDDDARLGWWFGLVALAVAGAAGTVLTLRHRGRPRPRAVSDAS